MRKQKVCLLPENLGQSKNLNIGLEHFVLLFLTEIYSLCIWALILIIAIVLHYLELIKLQLEHKVLYQLLQMSLLYSQHN